jgi:hypothetical protein
MLNEPLDALPLQPEGALQDASADAADSASTILPFPVAAEAEDKGERLPGWRSPTYWPSSALVWSPGVFAHQLDTTDLGGFIVLGVLAVAFGRTRVPIYGDTSVSIGMVGDFAIAFLYGPAGAVIVSPFAAIATDLGVGAWYKRLFNVGLVVVSNVVVAYMIQSLVDIVGPGLPVNGWLIPIALAAIVVYYLMNISLVTVAVSLSTKTSLLDVWREKFEWLLPHYVVFGLLGLALALGYQGIGYFGIPRSSRRH